MRKLQFIEALKEQANITTEEATAVNDIMENHSLIGKKSKEAAVQEIASALNVDENRADEISNISYDILAKALKDKLLHPFGSQD